LAPGLTVDTVVRYLVDHGLLAESAVADGEVVVDAIPRRHLNLRVMLPEGRGFFVKQADPRGVRTGESLAAEQLFYDGVGRRGLAGLVPRAEQLDERRGVLVLELLAPHLTLRELVASGPADRFPTHVWRRVGHALGLVHATEPGDVPAVGSALDTFYPSPDAVAFVTPVALEVLRIVQSSGISEAVAQLADVWEPSTFCHQDLRADNVLVDATSDPTDVRLVDWELSGRADRHWDLASCLEAGITLSMRRFGGADLTLPVVQAAARATWSAYLDSCEGPAPEPGRAALFTGVRLALSALEISEQSGALTDRAVLCLQVAENIAADPLRASRDLLGLELDYDRAS
jgi:hypothetical protein